jgi:hypothetical protein
MKIVEVVQNLDEGLKPFAKLVQYYMDKYSKDKATAEIMAKKKLAHDKEFAPDADIDIMKDFELWKRLKKTPLGEGITSFLIKWFEKRGARFTQEQKNSIELHHAKYNKNETQIQKLAAESNAGENIDYKKLDRLQKEQEVLKDEITRIAKDAGAPIKDR